MSRVLQAQKDATKSWQENMQPDRIQGISIIFEGTNKAGQTATIDDLGTAVIKRNGTTLVNRPMGVFADMLDIREGSNLFNSVDGGEFLASVYIPFYALSLEQALNITGDNELNFTWEPNSNGISTNLQDLQMTVYTETKFLDEYYNYFILSEDQTPAGALNAKPFQLNRENITEIYLRDSGDILTDVALRQDGKQRYSNQNKNAIKAGTLKDNRLEVQDFEMLQLLCFTYGQPISVQNAKSVLELTTSGGGSTVEVTVCSVQPTNRDFYG